MRPNTSGSMRSDALQCPQCHHDAGEGAKFCAECGASLARDAPDLRDPRWARYVQYLHDRRVRRAQVVRRMVIVSVALVTAVAVALALSLTRGRLWPPRIASSTVEVPSAPTRDTAPRPPDARDSAGTPTVAPRVTQPPVIPPFVTAPPVTAPPVTAPPVTAPPSTAPPAVAPPMPARPPMTARTPPPPSHGLPATAVAPPPAPRASLPPRASPSFESRSGPAALPSTVGRNDAVLVGDLVIDLRSEARSESRGRVVDYSVRLARRNGAPVTDARVALRGQTPDGATVEAPLDRMTAPGVYETAVVLPASGLHHLSLRITRPDTAVELPIVPVPAS